MLKPLSIYIGFDEKEISAYHVCCQSIISRASGPVSITPLVQSTLRQSGAYWRERGPTEATAFSMTRFLVPYLSNYEGVSIFMDCDMLVNCDIYKVLDAAFQGGEVISSPGRDGVVGRAMKPVTVCQHDYVPKNTIKMEGQVQTTYPKKNWSSFMVFDNARCKALTPEYVNTATGLDLHRFNWLQENEVGELPLEFNWLVGEYERIEDPKIIHFTEGGPWFRDWQNVDYAENWRKEYRTLLPPTSWYQNHWQTPEDGVTAKKEESK